jgi:signal transduction histidine kinase
MESTDLLHNSDGYISSVYIQLSWAFAFIVVVAGITVLLLFRSLSDSLRREMESLSFSRETMLAQEQERFRIARDLHDTVAQELRGLSLLIGKIGTIDEKAEREKLCAQACGLQSGIQSRVRDICGNLTPPDLGIMELPDALLRLCSNFSERTGIECRANIAKNINLHFLDRDKQIQFYRIVQEALTNLEKHSHASLAVVILRGEDGGGISVSVSDDGDGFDIRQTKGTTQFGIRSMRERAALLGGVLTINSDEGEGTLVHLCVLPHHTSVSTIAGTAAADKAEAPKSV